MDLPLHPCCSPPPPAQGNKDTMHCWMAQQSITARQYLAAAGRAAPAAAAGAQPAVAAAAAAGAQPAEVAHADLQAYRSAHEALRGKGSHIYSLVLVPGPQAGGPRLLAARCTVEKQEAMAAVDVVDATEPLPHALQHA